MIITTCFILTLAKSWRFSACFCQSTVISDKLMRNMIAKKIIFIIAAFVFCFSVVIPFEKANAITLIPPRAELSADPEKTATGSIKVYNETEKTLNLYTSTANFIAKSGKEGVPEFLAQEENNDGLASWIQIEKGPITVLPMEYMIIDYTINVPWGADPGGHYAGIFFSSNSGEESGGSSIGVSSKVGSLILLRVSGKIIEEARLEEFKLASRKSFYENLPINFAIAFENLGNVHLRPEGEVRIKNMFGKEVENISVNKRTIGVGANILPKTLRHFEVSWTKNKQDEKPQTFFEKVEAEKNNFALGKYTASLSLAYGERKKNVQAEVSFWVFPWHLLLVYAIVILFVIVFLVLAIKRYNAWIINKAIKKHR